MDIDTDVLVIGAGICGLTTAFRLEREGLQVEVIDAAPRAGGVIGTERVEGLLYERGPNSILDTNPFVSGLLADLGILDERVETSRVSSKRYVVRGGKLIAVPGSLRGFLATPLFSFGAKLRLACEPFIAPAPAGAEESVAQFVRRRLGPELLDYAVEPFVAGVYAGNPDELSLTAAFPRLHALESRYGSLIKGQIKGARERAGRADKSRHVAASFSFRDGMQTLIDALVRALAHIHTGARATRLQRTHEGTFRIDVDCEGGAIDVRARAVVLAVPADAAAALVRDCAPDAAQALSEIPYAPVASVARAYARDRVAHPLDGFGVLVPRVEKRRILGSLFSSTLFEGRAPADTVLLTTFIGGRRDPGLALQPEEEIARIAHEELAALVGAQGEARLSIVTRWPRAIPQYTLGHLERVRRARQAEHAMPGLFLCASYRGGVAVGDCIKSACEMADQVAGSVLRAK